MLRSCFLCNHIEYVSLRGLNQQRVRIWRNPYQPLNKILCPRVSELHPGFRPINLIECLVHLYHLVLLLLILLLFFVLFLILLLFPFFLYFLLLLLLTVLFLLILLLLLLFPSPPLLRSTLIRIYIIYAQCS